MEARVGGVSMEDFLRSEIRENGGMKRPVWRYSTEATTDAPLPVVKARLETLDSPLCLSVFAPMLGGSGPKAWRQESAEPLAESEGWLRLRWTARLGGLEETAGIAVRVADGRCQLLAEGKLKGWPLLWKVGLLGWRSEGLLKRFVASL